MSTVSYGPQHPHSTEIYRAVQAAYDELTNLICGPLAALDPAKLYQAPALDEWSMMENLAHIVEFMPYWASEVTKLVASPGQPFGRTQQHEGRLKAIEEHGHESLAWVQAALPTSYAVLESVLTMLKDEDLELTGLHSKFGKRTLGWFINEFIVKHLQEHIRQLRDCL